MSKYSKMITSELLDLLTSGLDSEFEDILAEVETRSPFGYYREIINELEGKVEALESKFKKHVHVDGKIYGEVNK